jgi:hypothetical protein
MIWKGIVGRNFTPDAFREYVAGLTWGEWQPEFIVLHHTAVPSLAQRPNGFNNASMSGLERYYRDEMGWSAGPHLFVDDQPAGIWVFTPLTTPGVHAKSFNGRSLGLEMLGNYDVEDFDTGRGALVRDNAVAAIAILSNALRVDPDSMMFHRDEPNTTKTCPGRNVDKAAFIRAVKDFVTSEPTPGFTQLSDSQAELTQTQFKPEEFGRAREYLPVFQAAADAYRWPAELEAVMQQALGPRWMAWILMGIASRESRFGLLLDENGRGDGGHGHGIMQVDDRSHAAFCDGEGWQDLRNSLEYVHHNVIVPSFNYLGENCFELVKEDYRALFKATVAAYNCGPGNVRKALEAGTDMDSLTTGRDYAKDVLARAKTLYGALT